MPTSTLRSWFGSAKPWSVVSVCLALSATPTFLAGSEARRTPIVKAVSEARDGVVNIHGQKTITSADDPSLRGESPKRVNGMGTGIFVDERGYILTNHHVVDGVKRIEVTLSDKTTHVARFIASNPAEDLAIIKLDVQRTFPVMSVGGSHDLMVGESVIAMGNAFGYDHTVTRGIISALHRSVQINETQSYEDLIQTDASINPGNSGGPLMNIDGQLIGVNVAVRAGANGIGFAIPIDRAMNVAAELMSVEKMESRWHGLTTKPAVEGANGLTVQSVEKGSPAEQAGIRAGDVIETVERHAVARQLDIERYLLGRKNAEPAAFALKRNNEPVKVDLTLAAKTKSLDDLDQHWQVLGVKLTSLPASQFKQMNTRYRGGLVVNAVREGGPAAKQGIKKGDILVGLHVWETISNENIDYVLSRGDLQEYSPLKFLVLRNGESLFGYLPVTIKR
ncbi:MAG: trypsin-like peptidase domain-containing protein [Pirellulales bacterium]